MPENDFKIDKRSDTLRAAATALRSRPDEPWPRMVGVKLAHLLERVADEHDGMRRRAEYVEVADPDEAARLRRGPECLRYAVAASDEIVSAATGDGTTDLQPLRATWVSRELGRCGLQRYNFGSRAGYAVRQVDPDTVRVTHVEPYGADPSPARPGRHEVYTQALANLGYTVADSEDGTCLLVTRAA